MATDLAPGSPFLGVFSIQGRYGVQDADSLPVGSLIHNGAVDSSVVLIVTRLSLGLYTIAGTLPATYQPGDTVYVMRSATVDALPLAEIAVLDIIVVAPSSTSVRSPYVPGASFSSVFSIQGQYGLQDADSLPTGSVVHNGVVDSSVTITITRLSTGLYTASGVLPLTYRPGDTVFVLRNAIVSTLPLAAVVVLSIIVASSGVTPCPPSTRPVPARYQIFLIAQGDYGTPITDYLTDLAGDPIDMDTVSSVQFTLAKQQGAVPVIPPTDATINTNGTVTYIFPLGQTASIGADIYYLVRWLATLVTGGQTTCQGAIYSAVQIAAGS